MIGLDFALLQKVRSEIANREKEDDTEILGGEEAENAENAENAEVRQDLRKNDADKNEKLKDADPLSELQSHCRTVMARNVVR